MGPEVRTPAALEDELQALRQREQSYCDLLETMGVIACQSNPGAPPHWMVGAVLALTGHPAEDFVSGRLRWEDLIHPDDLPAVLRGNEGLHNATAPLVREYRVRHANAHVRWVEECLQADRGAAGEITRIRGTIRDITLQKQAAASRRAQDDDGALEARFRNLVEQVPAVVYTSALDEFSATTYASPQVERLLGYPQDVFQGDPHLWKNCLHPDDRERVLAELAHSQATSAPFASEYRAIARDGRVVWIRDEGAIVRDDRGRPLCLQGVMCDITERKRAEAALQENTRKLRAILDQTYQFIGLTTPDGTLIEANQTALRFSGVDKAAVLNRPFWEGPWWAHSAELQETLKEAVQRAARGEFVRFEATHPAKDGSLHDVDFSLKPVTDETGAVVFLIPEGRDITERKQAEAALRDSREFLTRIINAIPDPVFVKDRAHRLILVNDAEAALTGYSREEVLGHTDYDFFPKTQVDVFWQKDEEAFATGHQIVNEEEITDARGALRTIVTKKTVYTDTAGQQYLVGILRDITVRKRAEEVLRRSEEELRLVTDNLTALVVHLDQDLHYRFVNRPYLEWYALPREQIIGRHVRDVVGDETFRAIEPHIHEALTGEAVRYEAPLGYRDGKTRWVDITYVPEYNAAGQVVGLYALIHDLTQRRQIEEAIRESEERFRTLVENTADGVGIVRDGKYEYVNPAAQTIHGRPAEELLGHSPSEFMPSEHRARAEARMQDLLHGAAPHPATYEIIRPDGSRAHVEIIANAVRQAGRQTLFGVLRDVTAREQLLAEKKLLAEQLHRAQTVQAVGQIAVSIAHGLGNLLAAMRNGVNQLRLLPAPSDEVRSTLSAVSQAVEEAVSTTQSLLLFSRRLPTAHAPLDLCQLVGNAAKFLRHLLPAAVRVETHVPADTACWVSADAGQLRQVLLNLALNARDAMPHGGTLRVSLAPAVENGSARSDALAPGGSAAVRLIVEDTGSGMPPEVRARVFEPFFTTKPAGEGTGLGLVTVQNVVRDHGGHIDVESQPGAGARFTIVLPTLDSSARPAAQPAGVPAPSGRGQTILLLEADPFARRALISALHSWEYQVQAVDDSEAAWAMLSTRPQDYVLLLLAVEPPAQAGLECLRQLRAAGSSMPVILMTRAPLPKRNHGLDDCTTVLKRPFPLASLGQTLATLLAETPRDGGDA